MTKHVKKNRGISILGVLFLGFIVILILSYFHISIKAVVESPTGQENIHYVGGAGTSLWSRYLAAPASYLWNDIWLPLIWRPLVENIKRIEGNKPADLSDPTINTAVP